MISSIILQGDLDYLFSLSIAGLAKSFSFCNQVVIDRVTPLNGTLKALNPKRKINPPSAAAAVST
jgi:hypothetical protein